MLDAINTILSILGVSMGGYEMVSTILQGDSTDKMLAEMEQTNRHLERLNDHILYAPDLQSVRDTNRTVQQIETDHQKVYQALDPVQQALGGDILSSAVIVTPEQMRQAMRANPFDVLLEVRPVSFAQPHSNPSMVPIMFDLDGTRYIGWQTRGVLPMLFHVEYTTATSGLTVANTVAPKQEPPKVELPKTEAAKIPVPKQATSKLDLPKVEASKIAVQEPAKPKRGFLERIFNSEDKQPQPEPIPAPKQEQPQIIAPEPTPILPKTKIEFDWVHIPAGEFRMGSAAGQGHDDERPQHTVHPDEYYIARVPTTNLQYEQFVKATGHRKPRHWRNGNIPNGKVDHPVVHISWDEAMAFCKWVGAQLPTEAQWEKAARGTDSRVYSWGNATPNDQLCNFNENVDDTTPVGKYPQGASPYGCLDMAGNVWEWVADWHSTNYYQSSPKQNPTGPTSGIARVLRGGSWYDYLDSARVAYRLTALQDYSTYGVGCRLVFPIRSSILIAGYWILNRGV